LAGGPGASRQVALYQVGYVDLICVRSVDDHSDRQRRSLGTIDQLANVLGSDNATHTTEVDTLPCSGIRIPHGPLSGLLGWKLVVRPAPAGKNGWWNETARARRTQHRRSAVLPSLLAASSQEQTLVAPMRPVNAARFSTLSLPLTVDDIEKPPLPPKHNTRNVSVDLTRRAHIRVSLDAKAQGSIPTRRSPSPLPANHRPPSAVVVNFVLDTGVQHSTISRDTLNLMGYSVDRLPLDEDEQPFITLLIQGLPSRFRLAAPGDMSRLGVQFLQDAGLSLYFPRDHRDGPVLYGKQFCVHPVSSLLMILSVEPERLSMDAPSTVPRQTPKMTIPQRVRALFGL